MLPFLQLIHQMYPFLMCCVSHLEKDQQPVVPQPTNYKPKVINDIKAQVNKGRLVIIIIYNLLNYTMYDVYLPRMHWPKCIGNKIKI